MNQPHKTQKTQNRILLFLLIWAACWQAQAATYVTATLTITNAPTVNGNALTVNGNARTFTNNTAASLSTLVATNVSIGGSATNLYNQIAAYPFSAPLVELRRSGTNGIILVSGVADGALAASISAGWATLTLVTNVTTNTFVVRVPMSNTAGDTNTASLALKDITEKSTNAVSASSSSMANFVNTSTAQAVGGAKSFTGANTYANANQLFDGGRLTNIIAGITTAYISNLITSGRIGLTNLLPVIFIHSSSSSADEQNTWLVSYGGETKFIFVSDDGLTSQDAFTLSRSGTDVTATTLYGIIYGTNYSGGLFDGVTITNADGYFSAATITNLTAKGGTLTGLTFTNGTYFGTIGLLSGGYLASVGATNLVSTNATFNGTNTFTGAMAFQRLNHTSLANGGNAGVDFGNTMFAKIKAGPTGAFSINGIVGGSNGRTLWLYNSTGQNMTIANENGGEPTPANRITTMTGADVATTGNGAVFLWYDSDSSRWILLNSEL